MLTTQALIASATSILALLGAIAVWVKRVRPRFRRWGKQWRMARDSIVGRDPIVDSITGVEKSPALPGIGVRMATTETQLGTLTEAVAKIADSHARLENHEGRLNALEAAAVERIVTKADSVAAWRAVEAVAGGHPGDEAELD